MTDQTNLPGVLGSGGSDGPTDSDGSTVTVCSACGGDGAVSGWPDTPWEWCEACDGTGWAGKPPRAARLQGGAPVCERCERCESDVEPGTSHLADPEHFHYGACIVVRRDDAIDLFRRVIALHDALSRFDEPEGSRG